MADNIPSVVEDARDAGEALAEAAKGPTQPVTQSKWYQWRKDGTALIAYLLDSEVHTFAFSVAANAILSFIPFVMLLYTLALSVFHSQAMVNVVDAMVNYFLPSVTKSPNWLANSIRAVAALSSRHGIQALSLVMILISCTGIFLPLEVALNQAWGVKKSRNYLFNQTIAFGLALLMVGLAVLGFTYTIPLLLVVSAAASSGTGLVRAVLTSLITQKAGRSEQGVVLGLTQSLNSIAQIIAPAIGGLLIDHSLLAGWAVLAAAICGVALLL